jgi:hypothetical protein
MLNMQKAMCMHAMKPLQKSTEDNLDLQACSMGPRILAMKLSKMLQVGRSNDDGRKILGLPLRLRAMRLSRHASFTPA